MFGSLFLSIRKRSWVKEIRTTKNYVVVCCLFVQLSGCKYFIENWVRNEIPSAFEISALSYFEWKFTCVLAIYTVTEMSEFDFSENKFKLVDYDPNAEAQTSDTRFMGNTLLDAKNCADESVRNEFMSVHSDPATIFLTNTAQNAVIAYHGSSKKIYFSGGE